MQDDFMRKVAACEGPVRRLLHRKLPQSADVDDIWQEVQIAAWKSQDALRDHGRLKAWLVRIANNKCADFFRAAGTRVKTIERDGLSEGEMPPFARRACAAERDERTDPAGEGAFAETPFRKNAPGKGALGGSGPRDRVPATRPLGEEDRELLSLHYLDKVPLKVISDWKLIPLGTVKSRLHRARKRFEQAYPDYFPRKEPIMKTMPDTLPEYTVEWKGPEPFEVVWREVAGYFCLAEVGASETFARYYRPTREKIATTSVKATRNVIVHGVEGIELEWERTSDAKAMRKRTYDIQITDGGMRFLAAVFGERKGRTKRIFTFLDEDKPSWIADEAIYHVRRLGAHLDLEPDYPPCNRKPILSFRSDAFEIERTGTAAFGIAGRFAVRFGKQTRECIRLVDIVGDGACDSLWEFYIDREGRTVLRSRFCAMDCPKNKGNRRVGELMKAADRRTVNGRDYCRWYDTISTYVLP